MVSILTPSLPFVPTEAHRPAPRLKDAAIPEELYLDIYVDLINTVRKIYHECRLVHADLSEYNILYLPTKHQSKGALYIIDVSQSVEHDHPLSFDFLRKDLSNIEHFFGTRGVRGVGVRRGFEYVIAENSLGDETLRRWMDEPEPEHEEQNN